LRHARPTPYLAPRSTPDRSVPARGASTPSRVDPRVGWAAVRRVLSRLLSQDAVPLVGDGPRGWGSPSACSPASFVDAVARGRTELRGRARRGALGGLVTVGVVPAVSGRPVRQGTLVVRLASLPIQG